MASRVKHQNEFHEAQAVTDDVENEELGHSSTHQSTGEQDEQFAVEIEGRMVEKDGLRSWVMCFASALVAFVVHGFYKSFGLFLVEFLEEFKESEALTASVGSLAFSVKYGCYLLGSFLQYYFNVQTLMVVGAVLMTVGMAVTSFIPSLEIVFVTYGIVYGLGTGLATCLLVSSVPDYFDKKIGLATALVMSGASFAGIVYPRWLTFLLQRYNWRMVMRILLYAPVVITLASFSFKRKDFSTRPQERITSKKQDFLSLLTDWHFLFMTVAIGLLLATNVMVLFFIVLFCKDLGYTVDQGSWLLTYYGISSFLSQLSFGFVMDFVKSFRKINIYIFLVVFESLLSCQVAFATQYWFLVLYSVLGGFFLGGLTGTIPLVIQEILHGRNFKAAWGIVVFSRAALQMAGPPIAGLLVDTYDSYSPVFLLRAAVLVLVVLLLTMVSWSQKKLLNQQVDMREPRDQDL